MRNEFTWKIKLKILNIRRTDDEHSKFYLFVRQRIFMINDKQKCLRKDFFLGEEPPDLGNQRA